MKHITGLVKELILLTNGKNKELRNLPLDKLWYLHHTFSNEKLTKLGGKYIVNTFMPPFPTIAFEQFIKNVVSVYSHKIYPYSAYLALTNKCHFNCWHCSKAYREGQEISKEKWMEVIKDLQDFGVSIIGFTGGEPLLRNDLEDIIKSIDKRSASILFTTGDGLDKNRAMNLKNAGLSYIAISLDHYDQKEHNKLRGSDKAFDIALKAIEVSRKNNFYTAVQLTIRKDMINPDSLHKYLDFVNKLGVQEIRIIEPMPTGKLINEKTDIFLEEKDRKILRDFHMKVNKNSKLPKIAAFTYLEDKKLYGCGAGIQHVYIDALGNLCPCDFTPLSFGNIQTETFTDVFHRLQEKFNVPRDRCFILDNIDNLRPYFEQNLPIGYKESSEICNKCARGNLPTFYKKLGWK